MSARKATRLPRVVLAGRPNVGKSTLFNRVTGARGAIVTSVPGTTRDVLRESVEWQGTGFELVDTGGLFGASQDPLQAEVSERGLRALAEDQVDAVLMLVDGRDGLVSSDENIAARLRRLDTPVVLAVNKVDDPRAEVHVEEFHALGFEPVLEIAAEHGLGVGDLLDAVVSRLPGQKSVDMASESAGPDDLAVAIVGRPNVGKSSLVNLLAREDRVLVSDLAGTTRDSVDIVVRWKKRRLRLVDTAGIRRPGQVAESGRLESVSVTAARKAMKRADVAVVMIDASDGVTKRDAAIAGEAERAGCGLVLAANKWDLVKGKEQGFADRFDETVRRSIKFAEYAPIVHVSALTGHRAPNLLELVEKVGRARGAHIATPELNRFLEKATSRHVPGSRRLGDVKIQYGTQVGVKPPRFVLFTNTATSLHFSYERFLKNRLRETFDFIGTPIRIQVRSRRSWRPQG